MNSNVDAFDTLNVPASLGGVAFDVAGYLWPQVQSAMLEWVARQAAPWQYKYDSSGMREVTFNVSRYVWFTYSQGTLTVPKDS